ncbi:isoprenoid biosynthesis protein ElbB [Parashewanella spongiae]|uniref:Glyoxalase n=1 Tax=Parashewanella spongiae TaxID=342950 RepID=A0A3A6TI59_9GAMM|nr:isoprenoid biosynthesis glyoxalase ElbB [Parashewanella spongiae]MCL1078543.1 isoprenoid biosynthesis glyoxalase ElbB [Parashewanella spongiae]RJY13315.1 isoprenoid biosynthesis protein ElbB [Parashewanella spongiae]
MKKVAVLLSGCGVFDGCEVNEAVLTLLTIATEGASYQCFAPDQEQMHVIDHLSGNVAEMEKRNVLVESARIARGEVLATTALEIDNFDALIIPGGYGAAKNLCDFAVNGADCEISTLVESFIDQFKQAQKPVGFICISPVMIPKIYPQGATGTIGTDEETAAAFDVMGGQHQQTNVDDIVVDSKNKVVSTPAYMLANTIVEAHKGIEKLVKKVIALT